MISQVIFSYPKGFNKCIPMFDYARVYRYKYLNLFKWAQTILFHYIIYIEVKFIYFI